MTRLFKNCKHLGKLLRVGAHEIERNILSTSCCQPINAVKRWCKTAACDNIEKVVFVSKSKNIFENLALEDWLYQNVDLTRTDYLLMWQNGPAVVIGRHQNPWLECNVPEMIERDIALSRRNSGGGTVYHDEGNLNLSFLMHRSRYNRRKNLSLVVSALKSRWDLDLDLNCRDDLVLDGVYKVSGTASKLSGQRTYHHFTLVMDVDKEQLSSILYSPLFGVDSSATKSVPSSVRNLKEVAPEMTFDSVVRVIGHHFLEEQGKMEITVVDPSDESQFPGVTETRNGLMLWDWVYGKTPTFKIARTFAKSFPGLATDSHQYSLKTELVIDKGRLQGVTFRLSRTGKDGADVVGDLPFRLPEVVDVVGERLDPRTLPQLLGRCQEAVKKLDGCEDLALLAWGVDCLSLCLGGIGPES